MLPAGAQYFSDKLMSLKVIVIVSVQVAAQKSKHVDGNASRTPGFAVLHLLLAAAAVDHRACI